MHILHHDTKWVDVQISLLPIHNLGVDQFLSPWFLVFFFFLRNGFFGGLQLVQIREFKWNLPILSNFSKRIWHPYQFI